MYYPEYLPDADCPEYLWGTRKAGRSPGTNQFFGTLRYGDLLEVVLHDCRRFADYKGVQARLLLKWTEGWLIRRTLAEGTAQFFHAPSLPFAYTSGKLGEWYPDIRGEHGRTLLYKPSSVGSQVGSRNISVWLKRSLASGDRVIKNMVGTYFVDGKIGSCIAARLTVPVIIAT